MNNLVKKYNLSKKIIKIIFGSLAISALFAILGIVFLFGTNIDEHETSFIIGVSLLGIYVFFFIISMLVLSFLILKREFVKSYVIYSIYILKKEKFTKRMEKSPLWRDSLKLWNYEIENLFNDNLEAWIEHNWNTGNTNV